MVMVNQLLEDDTSRSNPVWLAGLLVTTSRSSMLIRRANMTPDLHHVKVLKGCRTEVLASLLRICWEQVFQATSSAC